MLREILTKEEKQLIDWYREDYAFENITHYNRKADVDGILQYWAKYKGDLYQLLGNKLMISNEVSIEAPREYLESELSNLMDRSEGRRFYNWFRDLGWELYENDYELRDGFWSIMSFKNLIDNRVHGEGWKFKMKNGKVIQVPHGSKPMKALAKIAEEYGKTEEFEEFRLAHSRILNIKKIEGELVISIHPLDFMTMSDNASGWSSCMSWKECGCYRRGTVEMMNSDIVVVAYLKGKQDMKVPGGYWNNKKWRQLFIVDHDFMAGVKPYPYYCDELTKTVMETLEQLAKVNWGKDYMGIIKYDMDEGHVALNDTYYHIYFETNTMYNDLENVEYTYVNLASDIERKRIFCNYSGVENCMYCGRLEEYDYDACDPEGLLVCCECYQTVCCYVCGDCHDIDSMVEVDGHMVCEYCYERNTCETVDDNEYHLEDDVTYIHLTGTKEGLHWSNERIPVWSAYDSDFIKENFNINEFHYSDGTYYVTVDECKPHGLELFGFNIDFDMEEIENYKIEFSLNANDRYERRQALNAGLSWPISIEEVRAREAAAVRSLTNGINGFLRANPWI